jgi:hypothetical protein
MLWTLYLRFQCKLKISDRVLGTFGGNAMHWRGCQNSINHIFPLTHCGRGCKETRPSEAANHHAALPLLLPTAASSLDTLLECDSMALLTSSFSSRVRFQLWELFSSQHLLHYKPEAVYCFGVHFRTESWKTNDSQISAFTTRSDSRPDKAAVVLLGTGTLSHIV